MPVYELGADAPAIADRLSAPDTLLVACLCAAWCNTCDTYRSVFDAVADLYPAMCFVWIDIETHADQVEALEIENLPTILIEDARGMHFLGAIPTKKGVLKRLIDHYMAEGKAQKDTEPGLRPFLTS